MKSSISLRRDPTLWAQGGGFMVLADIASECVIIAGLLPTLSDGPEEDDVVSPSPQELRLKGLGLSSGGGRGSTSSSTPETTCSEGEEKGESSRNLQRILGIFCASQ
jgi:hypothetical protein